VLFPVVLGGYFRSPLLVVFLGCFRDLALGDLMGEICGNPLWFFGLFGVLGAQFWGFRCSRVRGVLGGISSIPLDLASFGGQNRGYGLLMRCSYHPQSLVQVPVSDSGDRGLDLEELTRGCCSSRAVQATPV
jgi:hypothetical protein